VGPAGQVMVTYQNATNGQGGADIYTAVDPDGLGAAGFSVANAISFLLVGYLADLFSPATAVALAGVAGLVMLIPIYLAWPTQELRQDVRRAYGPDAEMSSW